MPFLGFNVTKVTTLSLFMSTAQLIPIHVAKSRELKVETKFKAITLIKRNGEWMSDDEYLSWDILWIYDSILLYCDALLLSTCSSCPFARRQFKQNPLLVWIANEIISALGRPW